MPKVKPCRIRALERARVFVGVKEQPPNSNRGPYDPVRKGGIDDWCRRANGLVGYPWCSAFVCAMFDDVGCPIIEPRRASVGFLEAWARQVGALVVPPRRPYRGDLICYRFDTDNWPDHIGIVARVFGFKWLGGSWFGTVRTIEGNTAAGDDADGGQVQVRYRSLRRCTFIRVRDDLTD